MKLTCEQKPLHEALGMACRATAGATALPVLRNVLLNASEETLHLTATDLEIGISLSIPATVTQTGEVTVPAALLQEIVAALSAGPVSLAAENELTLQQAQVRYRLATLPSTAFPALPEEEEQSGLVVPQSALRTALDALLPVTHADLTQTLSGVFFEGDQRALTLVATDRHRLALARLALPEATEACRFIVPSRVLETAVRLFDGEGETPMALGVGAHSIRCEAPGRLLVGRLFGGEFPPYQSLFKAQTTTRVRADRAGLLSSLRRAGIVAREAGHHLRVEVEHGWMRLRAEAAECGVVDERLPVTLEGEPFRFDINSRYLRDGVATLTTDRVRIDVRSPRQPILLRPDGGGDFIHVIMPLGDS